MNTRRRLGRIPPVSPFGLIQETLWPDEWKILVACVLLNCTTRKVMEKIVTELFDRYPTPGDMAIADPEELSTMIETLGLQEKRAKTLIDLSKAYLTQTWTNADELPGIGEYGRAAHDIFVKGEVLSSPPKDGALVKYHRWQRENASR